MDLKKSSITADILNILSDCKVHTLQEIADEVEVHKNTVLKHIQSLAYRYPINTFCGGINRGGVQLDEKYLHQGKIRSRDELQIISQALRLLQKSGCDVDQELLASLIQEYSLPTKLAGAEKWAMKWLLTGKNLLFT